MYSWSKRSSTPNTRPTNDRFSLATTSTAAPMRISGATSKILFSTEKVAANTTLRRWRRAWRQSCRSGGVGERGTALLSRAATMAATIRASAAFSPDG
jgi:hypothetical protein